MFGYPASFSAADRQRVFGFLALFSRWECALKHSGFARAGGFGQAEADWRAFVTAHAAAIAALNDAAFVAARHLLTATPPKREELTVTGVTWVPNPRRAAESDGDYLLRVVRDVRNNLFHGGKFNGGPEPELARDRNLIDGATVVLETVAALNPNIRRMLDERATRG